MCEAGRLDVALSNFYRAIILLAGAPGIPLLRIRTDFSRRANTQSRLVLVMGSLYSPVEKGARMSAWSRDFTQKLAMAARSPGGVMFSFGF